MSLVLRSPLVDLIISMAMAVFLDGLHYRGVTFRVILVQIQLATVEENFQDFKLLI